jgi:hypothetical protein
MSQSPKTQRGHDRTQRFAGRRKPVCMAGSVRAGSAFDDTVTLEVPQSRDEDRSDRY